MGYQFVSGQNKNVNIMTANIADYGDCKHCRRLESVSAIARRGDHCIVLRCWKIQLIKISQNSLKTLSISVT